MGQIPLLAFEGAAQRLEIAARTGVVGGGGIHLRLGRDALGEEIEGAPVGLLGFRGLGRRHGKIRPRLFNRKAQRLHIQRRQQLALPHGVTLRDENLRDGSTHAKTERRTIRRHQPTGDAPGLPSRLIANDEVLDARRLLHPHGQILAAAVA